MSPLSLIPLIYLASILQIGLAPRWQIAGAGPDLLALIAVVWSMKSTGWHWLAAAVFVGLASDLSSTAPLGIGVAIYAVVAQVVIWWRRKIRLDRVAAQIAVVWAGVTAVTLLELAAGDCLGQSFPSFSIAIERTAIVGLYTTMISVPILLVMSWRCEQHEPALSSLAS